MLKFKQKSKIDDIQSLKTQVFIHDMEIILPFDFYTILMKNINTFSDNMNKKNQSAAYYRENRNASNAIDNIRIGKYGEAVACYCLRSCGFPESSIDFEIRTGKQKGWFCDIPFSEKDNRYPNVHVKTCNEKTRLYTQFHKNDEYSWVFQYSNLNNAGGRDLLFNTGNDNDLIAFVYISDLASRKVNLIATAPWIVLKDLLLNPISSAPISPKLNGLKRCIYYKDLLDLSKVASNNSDRALTGL